ncbi:uncharacterized protein LOC129715335 isoform X2 [Leucoraja erinacea]|uniref:uncharacterized protein LOC129715335 isoform X2 n=1 Tax=Leucoraja erinaceus TaxID=7782 RepID=UPI0024564C25|nr:uncharacterized protein LOC129715335 isoform X2 [Leucoraja erinacea]
MGDRNLAVGWYRFNSSGGWKIPETVVPENHCSGERPGWLDGPHPSVGDGEVTRTVCFIVGSNICYRNQEIRVKNCTGYFVYQLWPSPYTYAVYCTDSALGDPCVTHTVLDQPWRSTDCSNTECSDGTWMGDRNLTVGWYRFNSSGGWKIPETVVPGDHCSGHYPGWLEGPHPSVGDGEVTRAVCFTADSNICNRIREIRVKNCTGYLVYQLWPSPYIYVVYCTATDSALGDPCVTHTVLDQPWRSTYCSRTECNGGTKMGDRNLAVGWYRFNSSDGWKIPETVVPGDHCSGHYPGWLDGPHPSVGDGEVTRTVCFTEGSNICNRNREIRVKNCTGYFVYQLWPSPYNNAVYCTDPASVPTGEPQETTAEPQETTAEPQETTAEPQETTHS